MQGIPLGVSNGMPYSFGAITKLLRARRIRFLGLTATELDDFDGRCLAAALEAAPPRVDGQIPSKSEILDLTRIAFEPEIRARLLAAGEKAGVRVVLSRADGTALRS
jgi:hypothetical protein